jgi:glycosyltransferase involved in cell wall biosynthesis
MRIAMVSEHASPLAALGGVDAGGQNVHVAALATALARRGHQVTVYTRRDDPDLPESVQMLPGVRVVHVPAGPAEPVPKDDLLPHMPAFGHWLGEHLAATGVPDVVHSHFWMSGLAVLASGTTAPLVHTYHALGTVKRRYQGDKDTSPAGRIEAETRIGTAVDLVVATCRDEVRELVAMGVPPDGVDVVPCGVDVHQFSPEGEQAPRRDGMRRLVYVGRLVERKGVDTVVRVLPRLPGTELVVVGGSSDQEADPVARGLRELAEDLGVADRLDLRGPVARGDVPGLIRSADAVVAVPWYEPFGIVPLEAAACGRPLVGSRVGGLLDSVAERRTGLLVPPRDPDALAEALQVLLDDATLNQRMGREARRRAEELFSWEQVARSTEHAYRSVIDQKKAATA